MPPITLANLAAYGFQVAVLVTTGAGLLRLGGVAHPRTRLAFLRLLLAACVVLPLVRPLQRAQPAVASASTGVRQVAEVVSSSPQPPAGGAAPVGLTVTWLGVLEGALPGILVTGAAARLAWLAIGLLALRRLEARAPLLAPAPPSVAWAAAVAGARADFRTDASIDHPVSFGLLRPVVLVPPGFTKLDEQLQQALACHELIHVRRRDWLHVLSEELVRGVLWFHPAVWWLIDRIHLAREQVVDRDVVAVTGGRRPYVDLLLRLATTPCADAPAMAAAFFRRSHLEQRVAMLMKEDTMSRFRLSMSVGAVSVLACSGVGLAAGVLPLHRAPGRSPAAQRPAAHQEPGAASLRHVHEISEASVPVLRVQPVYPDGAAAAGVQGPVVLRVNCDASGTPAGVEATHGAPELTQAAIDALYQWRFEPAGEPRTFVIGVNVVPPVADDTLPAVPPARISKDVRPPTKIADVRPVYPVEAKEAGIQGIVIGEAQIGADGVVRDVRVLRSTAGLDEAAVAAVLQWRFTQTFVDGKAVPVLMTVTVNFTLAK